MTETPKPGDKSRINIRSRSCVPSSGLVDIELKRIDVTGTSEPVSVDIETGIRPLLNLIKRFTPLILAASFSRTYCSTPSLDN
jgi:hypothetical protein